MLDMVPRLSAILWISITVLQFFLAMMILRWHAWKRYPVMSIYVGWQAVGGVAGLLIAAFAPPMPYFFAYYVDTLLADIIAFAVALELYYKVCDPRIGLSVWRPRHMVIMIAVSSSMAIMFGLLWAAKNGGSWTRTMVTMEEIMNVALWATFCILLIYWRSLGFTWRPLPGGIALGFLLYLTISVISVFIRGRLSLGAALIAGQVEMAANILSLAWWLGIFRAEEKPLEATPAQVEETPGRYSETMEAASKML